MSLIKDCYFRTEGIYTYMRLQLLHQVTMKGFGLGFGGNYIGSTFYNDTNTITVPDAFVINSSVYLARRKYRLSLKADNLTNKYYWASLNPQIPFRLSASLQLMF